MITRRIFNKAMISVPAVMTLTHGTSAMASIGTYSENQALHSFCVNGPSSLAFTSFMNAHPYHPRFTQDQCANITK